MISVTDRKAVDSLTALKDKHNAIWNTWTDLAREHGEIVEALERALEALGDGK